MQKVITDDMEALLAVLPARIRQPLEQHPDVSTLLEIVLDLGRPAEARFHGEEVILGLEEITEQDIEHVVSRISGFGDDNRAGIERTLHRISAIRNRKGRIIGLTLRVGRAVFGTIQIIRDLVESGKSVLLLGGPGVGKTTMLREVARVLADDLRKRVIIVDTSNEIAGDGDIPHPAIGHARRMQVATPLMQHAVMIEAVENHMPEIIIIDEIGTELEAQAARTIAERGVQLVGTAHGNTLSNLMQNPTLSDLIGGLQSVTLGDEEARRRGTQKTVLERRSPPTFDIVVEIQDWDKVAIHPDVAEAVDAALRGQAVATETRQLTETGEVKIALESPELPMQRTAAPVQPLIQMEKSLKLFLFGVNRGRLEQVARELGVGFQIVSAINEADLFVTSKNQYRLKPPKLKEAEYYQVPIYVLKSNTPPQLRQFLTTVYPGQLTKTDDPFQSALNEVDVAVSQVKNGQDAVELAPQSAYIRRLQHLIVERHHLTSRSVGKEPNRRLTVYKERELNNNDE